MGHLELPEGKKIAVNLGTDFDAQSLWLGGFNKPSRSFMSRGEFGAKVGVPRLLALYEKYDVKTTTSDHYNLKNPTTEYNTADDCVAESGGQKGFTVNVTRERSSATEKLPKETLTWTYRPWNKVVCGAKP